MSASAALPLGSFVQAVAHVPAGVRRYRLTAQFAFHPSAHCIAKRHHAGVIYGGHYRGV
jgi:hypothetical protein